MPPRGASTRTPKPPSPLGSSLHEDPSTQVGFLIPHRRWNVKRDRRHFVPPVRQAPTSRDRWPASRRVRRRRLILQIVSPLYVYSPRPCSERTGRSVPFSWVLGRLPSPRDTLTEGKRRVGIPYCSTTTGTEWRFVVKRTRKPARWWRRFSPKSVDMPVMRAYHAQPYCRGRSGGLAALDEHHRHIDCRVCRAERRRRPVLSTRGDSRRERSFY